jgi:uncharacterized protein with HEPN domain
MTQHDDTVSLRHMLDYAHTARRLADGRSREELDSDEMLQLALTRAVEVIGEAAKRVSPERQKKHPNIQWPQIMAARNRLIHGYDVINLNILWDIIQLDLPELIAELEQIVQAEGE